MTDKKNPEMGGCPMHHEPSIYGSGDLSYNDYLKIPDLLGLQIPQSTPPHHDEMLFIIIHQSYELWFKLVLHEIDAAMTYMNEGNILRARHFIHRVVEIMKLLVKQIHILETMTPVDFLAFRDRLAPASGFQSIQFREIEFVAGLKDERYLKFFQKRPDLAERLKIRLKSPDLRSSYYDLLIKLGYKIPKNASELERTGDETAREQILTAILPVYKNPDQNMPLYLLTESLVEFDQTLALWREHHVRVVERVIGFKRGTGGSSGVEYLQSTTSKKCFPYLWEVRTRLSVS